MKSLFVAAATVAVVAGAPIVANAQENSTTGYASLGYSQGDYDGGADLGTVQGRIGARFGQYLGVEGELGLGAKSDDTYVGGLKADNSVKHQAGVYGVGYLPIAPNADLYARVGYGDTKVKTKLAGVPDSDRTQSWNYGVGGQYFFDGANGVRADYTRHEFLGGDDKADVMSVGYVRKF
jgi:hypothetical protein